MIPEPLKKVAKALKFDDVYRSLYFHFKKPADGVVRQTIEGVGMEFYVKDYNQLVYLTRTVIGAADEREMMGIMKREIKEGDVVYDIGSFIGFHAVFFAKCAGVAGKVIAFEPMQSSYQSLQKNMALNKLTNVQTLRIGLSDATARGNMKEGDMRIHADASHGAEEEIAIAIGDNVVQEKKLPIPNVVKIDVEGYEYQVILGLQKTLAQPECRFLCCEIHPDLLPQGVERDTVIQLIKSLGFSRVDMQSRSGTFHAFCSK
jgi:FkbM family methyltransferase